MNKNEFDKILNLHTLSCRLKNTLRTGWKNWQVEGVRIESVAEHIFSTCMLAVAFCATGKIEVDVQRLITMIVLHETEEILIGDITMFDYDELKTKKEKGRQAVLEIFKDFPNADEFLSIIEEYEARQTKEAIIAKQIDMLDADLQARLYEGHFNIEKVEVRFFKDDRTINAVNQGIDTVSQQFLHNDIPSYIGEFKEFAEFLDELEHKEKEHYNKMKNRF